MQIEKRKANFKYNIFFSFIIQAITYLIPVVLSPYLSRVLGADGIGQYSFSVSLANYFMIIVSWGFDSYGLKAISETRHDQKQYSAQFCNIISGKMILFAITISGYLCLVFCGNLDEKVSQQLLLVSILEIVYPLLNISFLFQGLENFRIVSIITVLINIIYLILVFSFVKTIDDLLIYAILKLGALVCISIILWFIGLKYISFVPPKSIKPFLAIKNSLPFLVPALLPIFASSLDQSMIGFLSNNVQVGYYQQASKIPTLVAGLIYAIAPVGLSRISFLKVENQIDEIQHKIKRMFQLVFLVSLPSICGLYIVSDFLIPAYFGNDFYPCISISYLLIPNILFSSLNSLLLNAYFYPSGKTKLASFSFIIDVLLNATLNFVFIPLYGAFGAALTTLISEFSLFVCLFIFSHKNLNWLDIFKCSFKPLLATIFMVVLLVSLRYILSYCLNLSDLLLSIILVCSGMTFFFIGSIIFKEPIISSFLIAVKRKVKK